AIGGRHADERGRHLLEERRRQEESDKTIVHVFLRSPAARTISAGSSPELDSTHANVLSASRQRILGPSSPQFLVRQAEPATRIVPDKSGSSGSNTPGSEQANECCLFFVVIFA